MLCEESLSDTIKITKIESFMCHYVQSHCYGEEVSLLATFVNGISFFTRHTFEHGM